MSTVLAEVLMFEDVRDQKHIDQLLREADGTEDKGKLGANAILSVSLGSGGGPGPSAVSVYRGDLWQ